jgi:hypothetical protein
MFFMEASSYQNTLIFLLSLLVAGSLSLSLSLLVWDGLCWNNNPRKYLLQRRKHKMVSYSFNKSAVVSYPKYSRKNSKDTKLTEYLQ